MPKFSFKETMLINNPEQLAARVGQETMVVCGAPRGLTSVVSYTLYECGYFIGSELVSRNYEDKAFQKILVEHILYNTHLAKAGKGRHMLKDHGKFMSLVQERNATHARWGFKMPDAVNYIDELPVILRNPVIVLCVRNPLAVARSILNRRPDGPGGIAFAVEKALAANQAILTLLNETECPSVVLNMEAVKAAPMTFLKEFTELFSLNCDLASVADVIGNYGYAKTKIPREGITFVQ